MKLAQSCLKLVSIPSESGEEKAIADYVFGELEASRPDYLKRHGQRIVAAYGFDPSDSQGAVLLAGHLDTVPHAGNPDPVIDGNVVRGLGASDMKGALAVMLALGMEHQAGGTPFGLVFYDCEEVSFDRNGLSPLMEAEPWMSNVDCAVLMEPTDNQIELGCMGTMHAKVTFSGRAAHSARPWQGENAIHKAGEFLQRLGGLPERVYQEGPAVYREVVNATMAEGGISRNVIPGAFSLIVNLRFPPDRSLEKAESYLRSLIPPGVEIEIVDAAPAAPARLDSPFLHRLAHDFGLEVRAKQAWTDVARFAQLGVPAVNYGPGLGAAAHQKDEYIPVSHLADSYGILKTLLGMS